MWGPPLVQGWCVQESGSPQAPPRPEQKNNTKKGACLFVGPPAEDGAQRAMAAETGTGKETGKQERQQATGGAVETGKPVVSSRSRSWDPPRAQEGAQGRQKEECERSGGERLRRQESGQGCETRAGEGNQAGTKRKNSTSKKTAGNEREQRKQVK